jgi:hypothetical protein
MSNRSDVRAMTREAFQASSGAALTIGATTGATIGVTILGGLLLLSTP